MAENHSNSVWVGLGNLGKEMEVASSESSGGVDDALNHSAIATSKCRSQLDGEVGERSLDRDREDTRGRADKMGMISIVIVPFCTLYPRCTLVLGIRFCSKKTDFSAQIFKSFLGIQYGTFFVEKKRKSFFSMYVEWY